MLERPVDSLYGQQPFSVCLSGKVILFFGQPALRDGGMLSSREEGRSIHQKSWTSSVDEWRRGLDRMLHPHTLVRRQDKQQDRG